MSKEEIHAGRTHNDTLKAAYFNKVTIPWWYRGMSKIEQWHHIYRRTKNLSVVQILLGNTKI